jgi:ABC-2 type transport system permease protein
MTTMTSSKNVTFMEELRERPGTQWAIQIHLAVLFGLLFWPLLKIGYERATGATFTAWFASATVPLLGLAALVLAFLLVELMVRAFDLNNLMDVAGREYALYYVSPIAYILGATFLFMVGYVFFLDYYQLVQGGSFGAQEPTLRDVQQWMGTVLLFILPLWTMRLLAEEQRQGTIELLLTSPVRDTEVVLGKYLGGLSLLMDTLALTVVYAVVLLSLGNPDPGPILGGYVGVLLFGAALMALGVFASSLTENQIIAAVISFALYLTFILLNAAAQLSNFVNNETLRNILSSLSIFQHLDSFTRGTVDASSVVFFLSVIAVSLFLATRVLETRRWR